MKITFIYTDYNPFGYNQNKFNLSVAILSACLKRAGHETSLIHISTKISKKQFLSSIKENKPSLIAFSSITNMWPQVRDFTKWASELNIPIIHGGIHPTIVPEEVIICDGVQIVCRGEGEKAIVDLCNKMQSGLDIENTSSFWIKKKSGEIIKNPIRPLIENLDELPYLDYDIFNYSELEDAKMKHLIVMASRGCPYKCTYCCNHLLKTLYPNKTRYVRFKSVDRLINEIKEGLRKYPFLESVKFLDDTLSLNKKWFSEFVDKYSSEIGLPYTCNDRVNQIDEQVANGFKKSGCVLVELGIESGNEYIRNDVMRRSLSDKQIINGYAALKEVGVKTTAFNIFGVPHETMSSLLETVKLNAKVDPDYFTNAYFQPFKGTLLYGICKEKGYYFDEGRTSFFERPIVHLDTVTEKQIMFIYKYFYILVRLYRRYSKKSANQFKKLITRTDRLLSSILFPYRFFNILFDVFDWFRRILTYYVRKIPFVYKITRFVWHKIKKAL